ncbi:hypothetical protein TSUD_216710 [Trifolium subterraneum]|uniref:Integrase catalytic domain-containing protein n=1 Tax=Trifolium subterraneum TaxID=3900 RepID=A0A2Z6MQA0_TRISU|nr:hypothetical protein TSUD_216710 [Trifolium subterraneum]
MTSARANAQIAESLATLTHLLARGDDPARDGEKRLDRFLKHKPSFFVGGFNPDGAVKWVEEVEIIFDAMECANENKLALGTYMLREEANQWWKNAKLRIGNGGVVITWEMFKREFFNKYFPADVKNKKVVEFMKLEQGNMSVVEYAAKFESLCAFSPHYNTPEAENDKCVKFESGLRPDIKHIIGFAEIRNFITLVAKARICDEDGKAKSNYFKAVRGKSQDRVKPYEVKGRGSTRGGKGKEKVDGDKCYRCGKIGHRSFEYALSQKSLHMSLLMAKELELIEEFRDLSLRVALVIEGQENDFKMDENGVVRFRGRVCVPDVTELKKMIFDEGHKSGLSIHPGLVKMYQDLKKLFWWPKMHKEIAEYVYACLVCQKSNIEHQKPSGLLQPLFIPEWKWDSIAMDFVGGLPKTAKGNEVIWVVVDRLTKSAHFIAIKIGTLVPKLAEIYVEQIIRLHGIPSSIVSDRDPKFTSRFWESLQEALGTKLRLSSAYHPQTDGQSERTIQSLEDLLRACVLEQGESWDSCLPLIEFTYNNSFHSSIGMAPFEDLYGRRCRTPLCWYESGETVVLGPDIVQETTEKIRMIREKMKASQSRQKSYHDKKRKDVEFQEGDHVFLRVTSTTGVGRALKSKKLTSKFIGPYQISERIGKVAYRIALPITLSNLHDVFHVSQLRKYVSDPCHVIESDDIQVKDNLTIETVPLRVEGREVKKLRNKEIASVKVIWGGPAGENATWELENKMKSSYPDLFSGGANRGFEWAYEEGYETCTPMYDNMFMIQRKYLFKTGTRFGRFWGWNPNGRKTEQHFWARVARLELARASEGTRQCSPASPVLSDLLRYGEDRRGIARSL